MWLQVDAQSGWPDVVAAANAQFQKDHPGWTVDVQYQNWGDHLQKFDATLAGGNTPDVIEMGNTEMVKYMAAGAFADICVVQVDVRELGHWLEGPRGVGDVRRQDSTACRTTPARASSPTAPTPGTRRGSRSSRRASRSSPRDAKKLAAKNTSVKGFSPVYIAGTDWYFAMSFVYDYGGSIAKTHGGKWVGNLDSKQSIAGLTAFKNFFSAASKASQDLATRTIPLRTTCTRRAARRRSSARAGSAAASATKFKTSTAQFVMPSHTAGQPMPGFLGGSDLAVPAPSKNAALAADWIKDFTSTDAERALQAKGNIPNATNLLGTSVNERAAARSWFVPAAKHWVDVENGNILRNMLAQILKGKLTVKQAAASASDNITSVLNGS